MFETILSQHTHFLGSRLPCTIFTSYRFTAFFTQSSFINYVASGIPVIVDPSTASPQDQNSAYSKKSLNCFKETLFSGISPS